MSTGIYILSTGELPKSLIGEARKDEIFIDTISFIHTEAIKTNGLKKLFLQLFNQEIVAVFTSMNAVEAVIVEMRTKPNWKIFCIAGATALRALEHFGQTAIMGTADNANALADVIIGAGVQQQMIFFCGTERRPELPDKLRANNIALKEIIVYRTIATPQEVSKNYKGIIFFSPSAVESFFSVNDIDTNTVLFAIGETTASTIQQYSTNKIITSERPGKTALAQQAIAYFKSINAMH